MRMSNSPAWRAWLVPPVALLMGVWHAPAQAQSLLEDVHAPETLAPAAHPITGGGSHGGASTAESLSAVSLFAVVPPKPRTYKKHDIVEIIINESSLEKLEQSLDTKKDYDFDAELTDFPSVRDLLELQFENGDSTRLPMKVGVGSKNKFKGDGEYERKDSFNARLSAVVLDVKPNGTLVLEAKESRQHDEETFVLVLSGVCRSDDITRNNTIQSSQIANLNIRVDHEGQVKKTSEKGLIPRVFEAIFNF